MRVAIEAGPLSLRSGGTARYVTELSLALARGFPEDEYILVSDQPFEMPAGPPNLRRGRGPRDALERRWWLWGLNRALAAERADVIHGPDFSVPYLRRRPSVMTLLDLSPWMDPAWHSGADRVRRRTPWLLRRGAATFVLTLTEAVRRQAIERFGLDPARVAAVPLAAGSHFRPVPPAAAERPYFLFVSTVEPRKNLPALIDAWRSVDGADLVIVGRRRGDGPQIPSDPGIRWMGEADDALLPALYAGAAALVYPSRYEGFGLPVLEAMQCGCMVIASRDPAIGEVAADAAIRVEDAGLAEAMRAALTQPELRAEYRTRGLRRAKQFTWERTASMTRKVYQEALCVG